MLLITHVFYQLLQYSISFSQRWWKLKSWWPLGQLNSSVKIRWPVSVSILGLVRTKFITEPHSLQILWFLLLLLLLVLLIFWLTLAIYYVPYRINGKVTVLLLLFYFALALILQANKVRSSNIHSCLVVVLPLLLSWKMLPWYRSLSIPWNMSWCACSHELSFLKHKRGN